MVLSPPTLAFAPAIQEYVEEILEVRPMFKVEPLHTVAVLAEVMAGTGFTVTVTV